MGGFLGIGGSSQKTDRGAQLGARQGAWNVFNWALPEAQQLEGTAKTDLGTAKTDVGTARDYWKSLLTRGRTETAAAAAPATTAALEQSDAARLEASTMGTQRTGGAAAGQREAGATTQKNIDDIINQTLQSGRTQGAQGVQAAGAIEGQLATNEMSQALSALGLSADVVNSIMTNATQSRGISNQINQQTQQQILERVAALAALMG